MLTQSEIKKILPHRYPMLLVDSILNIEKGSKAIGVKNITCNEPCYQGIDDNASFEDYVYPHTLLIESFCQVAGILFLLSAENKDKKLEGIMLFGSIRNICFYHNVYPGDKILHKVFFDKLLSDTALFTGELYVDDKKIAEIGHVMVAIRTAEYVVN